MVSPTCTQDCLHKLELIGQSSLVLARKITANMLLLRTWRRERGREGRRDRWSKQREGGIIYEGGVGRKDR